MRKCAGCQKPDADPYFDGSTPPDGAGDIEVSVPHLMFGSAFILAGLLWLFFRAIGVMR